MKRRILALICAATMVVGMGISASAATSATADDIAAATVPGADVKLEGTVVKIATTEGADVSIDLDSAALTAVAAEVAKDAVMPDGATITAADATAVTGIIKEVAAIAKSVQKAEVKVVDINAPTGGTFTLDLGIKAGETVTVLHSLNGGSGFERIDSLVAGSKVTFTAKSYSNYAFVITTGEVQDDDEEDSAPAASTGLPTTSPATAGAFATVAILALVSGGASAAFGRKSKKN